MRALVYATAPCVFDDVRAALRLGGFDHFYGVNAAPIHLPLADVWVSGHPEEMPRWQSVMQLRRLEIPQVVCKRGLMPRETAKVGDARVDRVVSLRWPGMEHLSRNITSTLFAVKIALADGAHRVVICGAPLGIGAGHVDVRQPQDHDYTRFRATFEWAAENVFADRVRAMSGWPAELLGLPTPEWLAAPESDEESDG